MQRVAYVLVVLFLLALLCWPRPIAPPMPLDSPPFPVPATEAGDAGDYVEGENEAPDSAADWSELLRATTPSTLPPPSDQGLLQDLEQAVSEIPRTSEAARESIEIRPEFAPLLPAPDPAAETEPEPDPDP